MAQIGRQSFRGLFAFGLSLPPPLAECGLNTLQDNIMNFDALFERRLPEALINGLREIEAGVNDSGPPLTAYGPSW